MKLGDADRMVVECIGSGSLTLGELLFLFDGIVVMAWERTLVCLFG